MRGVAVLGSTGSIGESALSVLRRHPDRFRVVALTAGSNAERLKQQAEEFKRLYGNVFINAALTFTEPFPVGLLITLISAAVLRKKAS